MSDQVKLAVSYPPFVEVAICDWERRFGLVNDLLHSPVHEERKEYVAKEVSIEPVRCEITGRLIEAKISITYHWTGEVWTWAPESAVSAEAN